jgi:ubiquinol-cytochrome c reductase cytochrome c subunit
VLSSRARSRRGPRPATRLIDLRAALGVGLIALAVALVVSMRSTSAVSAQVVPGGSGSPRSGSQIWHQDCAVCHGSDGRGSFQGPDISESGTAAVDFMVRTGRMPASLHRAQIGRLLAGPRAGETPRRPPQYTDAEVRRLVAYAGRFISGPEVPAAPDLAAADLATGGDLYRTNCAACHQMAGSGGALAYGTVGPPLTDSSPVQVVEAMRTGPGSMPVFGERAISSTHADDVAAYVHYLRHPQDRGGANLWHLGPVPEGLVAWVIGIGGVVLLCRWLGERERMRTG